MSDWDDYSAKKRCLQLRLPGNAGVVHAESAEITEGVNRLFRADVVFTGNTVFEPKKLIGSHAEAEFMFPLTGSKEAVRRHFSGVITDLQFLSEENRRYSHCRITLEPDLWRLAQSSDRRIWRRMSAVDVVETLIKEHNLPSAMFRLQGQPPVVEYSVQYGETDLHYMIRRLEAAGLFWWFFHEKGQHKLCVGDGSTSWATATEWADATAHFCLVDKEPGQNYIHRWQKSFSYVPHARTGGGWNFEMPDAAVKARVPSLIQYAGSVHKELFTYPSGAQTQEEAQRLETQRLQIDEARYCTIHAQSTVHVLAPARVFTPKFPQGGQLPDHVITTITHHISAVAPVSGEETSAYHNSFTAIPATVALQPEQKHKVPFIASTQTAIVAGPENEQIHCDKYGRVKLWFPWDRRAKKDGSDTDWIRTSQIWGGQDYGAQIVPRVGTEVLVSFLEGDPDHPIVTGTVVNPKTMPAYTLPDTKSRLTLRSQTYKGKGFNEISLEDADEKENFFMSAQKERTEVVGGSGLKRVVQHQIDYIGGNHASSVYGNSKLETKGSVHIAVGHSGGDVKNAFNHHSDLNNKTVNLLLQGAGLASGTAGDGLRTLAKAIDSKKLGFWSQEALGTQGEFLKSDAGLDAGSKLAEHGEKLAEDVSDAFQDSGEHHTIISKLRSSTVGGASVDQIAGGKVVNIGGVCLHHTAQEHLTTAGQRLTMLSGEATTIESKKIEIFADDNIRLSTPGGYIELTKSGITLHGLKIDIQGNHVDFQHGGGGEGTRRPLPES